MAEGKRVKNPTTLNCIRPNFLDNWTKDDEERGGAFLLLLRVKKLCWPVLSSRTPN
ncbi:hypothetical protein LINPERHAP2_LOCUS21317 [Linum perenne]